MQQFADLLKYYVEQFNTDWNLQYDNVVRKAFNKNPSNTDVEDVLLKPTFPTVNFPFLMVP